MISNSKYFFMCRLTFISLVLSFGLSLSSASIDYVSVEAEGRGVSLKEAIDLALTEAIGRVNGKSIEKPYKARRQ